MLHQFYSIRLHVRRAATNVDSRASDDAHAWLIVFVLRFVHFIHNPIQETEDHVAQSDVGELSTEHKVQVNPSPGALYSFYNCKVQMVHK